MSGERTLTMRGGEKGLNKEGGVKFYQMRKGGTIWRGKGIEKGQA